MTGSDPSGTVTRPKSNGGPGRDDRHARAFVNDGRCDRALRAHVDALSAIPRALVVRDGGDEVLIVGTPTGSKMGPFKAQVPNPGLMGAIARLCPERAFAIEYEEEST